MVSASLHPTLFCKDFFQDGSPFIGRISRKYLWNPNVLCQNCRSLVGVSTVPTCFQPKGHLWILSNLPLLRRWRGEHLNRLESVKSKESNTQCTWKIQAMPLHCFSAMNLKINSTIISYIVVKNIAIPVERNRNGCARVHPQSKQRNNYDPLSARLEKVPRENGKFWKSCNFPFLLCTVF